jgi:hypothetical protein
VQILDGDEEWSLARGMAGELHQRCRACRSASLRIECIEDARQPRRQHQPHQIMEERLIALAELVLGDEGREL